MKVTGAESIVVGVEDLEATTRFLKTYGLRETERGSNGGSYEALDGSGVEVRMLGDSALASATVNGPTMRTAVWGVEDADSLEAIGAELSKDRQVARDASGMLSSVDDDGHSIAFRVTRRRPYEAPMAPVNVTGYAPIRPINQRVNFDAHGQARQLGHLVYWSHDPDRSMKFYVERLGFRITDTFRQNRGVFARGAGHSDHHSLFFINSNMGGRQFPDSFQHVEFSFGDVQEIMAGGHKLNKAGFQTQMGPGRFELGSNWYWYFQTPMGGAFELGADIDQVDDNWTPGVWESTQEVAGWATTFNHDRARPIPVPA